MSESICINYQERLQTSIMRHLAAAWNSLPGTTVSHADKLQLTLSALESLLKAESVVDPWNTLVDAMEQLGKHEPVETIPFAEIKPQFTRNTPTEDHINLISHYLNMHANGYIASNGTAEKKMSAEEAYPGNELPKFAGPIKFMIDKHQAKTVMDYGSGKGKQYGPATVTGSDGKVFKSIPEFWGVENVHCYDPCVPSFCNLPQHRFDAVVSTDVLEHCFQADVPWIVREMFSYARKFVFANIACFPAIARLPNGENAHCTVKTPEWWFGLFHAISHEFHDLDYLICCTYPAQIQGRVEFKQHWQHRKAG